MGNKKKWKKKIQPGEEKVRIHVMITKRLLEQIEALERRNTASKSYIVRELIHDGLGMRDY